MSQTRVPRYTSWTIREACLKVDPDFIYESQHPVVYRFSRGHYKRDKGQYAGIYNIPPEEGEDPPDQ